jgi:hypothetical protein
MSEANPSDYDEKRKELINEAKETKEQIERKQNEALAEIAKGEDLEQYKTIQLGNLEMEVKAWVSGDATDALTNAMEIAQDAQEGSASHVRDSMQEILPALASFTVSNDYSMAFWQEYYRRYGPQGLMVAFEKVCGPALEDMDELQGRDVDQERVDAANGFRTDSEGEIVRSGRGTDGQDAE